MPLAAFVAIAGLIGLRWFHRSLLRRLVVQPVQSTAACALFAEVAPSDIAHHWCCDDGTRHLFADANMTWLGVMIATTRDPIFRAFPINAIQAEGLVGTAAIVEIRFQDLGWSPIRMQLRSDTALAEFLHLLQRPSG